MIRSRGRCLVCRREIALKKNHTLVAHGHGVSILNQWCLGSTLQPRYLLGDRLASTLNDTICEVVKVGHEEPDGESLRQTLLVRKISGERGWAAVGEVYPESNYLTDLVVPSGDHESWHRPSISSTSTSPSVTRATTAAGLPTLMLGSDTTRPGLEPTSSAMSGLRASPGGWSAPGTPTRPSSDG